MRESEEQPVNVRPSREMFVFNVLLMKSPFKEELVLQFEIVVLENVSFPVELDSSASKSGCWRS